MKRSAKIYMVLLVWIAAALQFFINEKMDIEEVFAEVQEAGCTEAGSMRM